MNRRTALKLFTGGAIAPVAGFGEAPAFFRFFNSPVRLDRYTRTTYDLVSADYVTSPAPAGAGGSLEMKFKFSEKYRYGMLILDVAPVKISRIRFQLFNPNASREEISFRLLLRDANRKICQSKTPRTVLPVRRWTTIETDIRNDFEIPKERISAGFILTQMQFRFETGKEFSSFGKPLPVYLSGVECF